MYQLTNGPAIKRIIDGMVIPPDPRNVDYQEFLAWKAAGNETLPAPIVSNLTKDEAAVCAAYNAVETANLSPAGAVQLSEWVKAGNAKAIACAKWVQDLYAERDAKLSAIERGEEVDPTPSTKWKPFSFREIAIAG